MWYKLNYEAKSLYGFVCFKDNLADAVFLQGFYIGVLNRMCNPPHRYPPLCITLPEQIPS